MSIQIPKICCQHMQALLVASCSIVIATALSEIFKYATLLKTVLIRHIACQFYILLKHIVNGNTSLKTADYYWHHIIAPTQWDLLGTFVRLSWKCTCNLPHGLYSGNTASSIVTLDLQAGKQASML